MKIKISRGKVAETSLVDDLGISEGIRNSTPPRDRLLFLDAVRLARAARRAPRSGATLSRGSQIGGRQPDYPCAAASR